MYKDCQVTDDGDVYEIQEDGSISKIGTIHELPEPKEEGTSALTIFLWIFLIVAIVAAVALGLKFKKANEDVKKYENLYSNEREASEDMESQRSVLQDRLQNAQSELQNLKSSLSGIPMAISKIETCGKNESGSTYYFDEEDNFPNYIKRVDFRLSYVGISAGYTTLNLQFYRNGSYWLSNNVNVTVYQGRNTCDIYGIGYDNYFPDGDYRVEIWSGGNCLGVKKFWVYDY